MKTSHATRKIKAIKNKYLFLYCFCSILVVLLTLTLGFIYISSQFLNLFYSEWIKSNLSFIFVTNNSYIQFLINISVILIICLLDSMIILLIYYGFNSKYQKKFQDEFFTELKLNDIYYMERRTPGSISITDQVDKVNNLNDQVHDYVFSVKSLFNLNFHQSYCRKNRKNKALLITTELDRNINGYIEIRFDDSINVHEFNEVGIYQFNIDKTSKYPKPLYINTNFGKRTSFIIDDVIVNKIFKLKKFTKTDFVLCFYQNKVFIYIKNWELRITDSLRKRLHYNSVDKKINSFTQLVDDIQDVYVSLLRNYEVMKYGK